RARHAAPRHGAAAPGAGAARAHQRHDPQPGRALDPAPRLHRTPAPGLRGAAGAARAAGGIKNARKKKAPRGALSACTVSGSHQSSLMFCFLTTSCAQSYCSLISLANSSGVLPDGADPWSSRALMTFGSFRATTAASRSLFTTSIGVPLGASRPYQTGWFSTGKPASLNVGTPLIEEICSGQAMAMACSLPAWI